MISRQMVAVAVIGLPLGILAWSDSVDADKTGNKETCASKYPNAPTESPRGYDYKNESDAYMALRRAARQAGYLAAKKGRRANVTKGPCVGHGKHVNVTGRRIKNAKMTYIGSLTSCDICEETERGPRLRRTVWRAFKDF